MFIINNILSLKNVTKSFPSFSLNKINLNLNTKDIIGIVGENGSGKTTLLNLIAGIIKPNSGIINISTKEIGYCFDSIPFPDNLSIKNINLIFNRLGWNWDEKIFNKYVEKLDLPITTQIKTFSKGMKMQLNICIALSHKPKILLLDELTSGLDPIIRNEVLKIIKEYVTNYECGVIINTHNLDDVVKICNKLILLEKGNKLLDLENNQFNKFNIEKIFTDTISKYRGG